MIGLAAIEQAHLACARAIPVVPCNDEKLSRILDVAQWYSWKDEPDGSRTAWFELIKDIPGYRAGTLLELSRLHEVLFGTKLTKPSKP